MRSSRSNTGAGAVESAATALSKEDRALLQKRFLDGSMYPYETMIALRRLMRLLAAKQPNAASDLGGFLAEFIFTGVYKPLLAHDPATMVSKIPWVKDFFFNDYDRVEASMTGASACRLVYCYESGVRPTRGSCLSLGAFWARTLELAGAAKVATTHSACICQGADRCEFTLTWSAEPRGLT
jgi:hypothetical protein